MVDRVVNPVPINDIRSQAFELFIQKIANRSLIIGNGNPESVIEAEQGALYMDEDAAAGDVLYIKRLANIGGDKTQGWRAV